MKLKLKSVLTLNCIIFSLVFILHSLRLNNKWKIVVEDYVIAQGVSIFVLILSGLLLYYNYIHLKKQK